MESLKSSAPRSDHIRSEDPESQPLPLQFIQEHGRRPHSRSSTSMFAVRSHARKYSAIKRQRREKPLQPKVRSTQISPKPLATALALDSCSLESDEADDVLAVSPIQDPGQDPAEMLSTSGEYSNQTISSSSHNSEMETQETQDGDEVQTNPPLVSPRTILGAGKLDPFQSYPIKATPYMYKLVDYYVSNCQDNAIAWQIENEVPVTGHSRIIQDWVPLCTRNAMVLSSLLLSSELALRKAAGDNPWSLCALKLLTECIGRLRSEINEPETEVTDEMIATVLNLAFSELLLARNIAKFENHRRGLEKMVKMRGGVEKLEGILKSTVMWSNILTSLLIPAARDTHGPDMAVPVRPPNVRSVTPSITWLDGFPPYPVTDYLDIFGHINPNPQKKPYRQLYVT